MLSLTTLAYVACHGSTISDADKDIARYIIDENRVAPFIRIIRHYDDIKKRYLDALTARETAIKVLTRLYSYTGEDRDELMNIARAHDLKTAIALNDIRIEYHYAGDDYKLLSKDVLNLYRKYIFYSH